MYLNDIILGSTLNIILADGTKVAGEYDGNIDHINFYLLCPNISNRIAEFRNTTAEVEAEIRGSVYSFNAEILRKSERTTWGNETVEMVIRTPIKESSRRKTIRVDYRMRVKIYLYDEKQRDNMFRGDVVCESITEDISKGGVRIWSDFAIEYPKETVFLLEFTLPQRGVYMIPATLTRNRQNVSTRVYNYDFGFVFEDDAYISDMKEKLIVDVVESKLKSDGVI